MARYIFTFLILFGAPRLFLAQQQAPAAWQHNISVTDAHFRYYPSVPLALPISISATINNLGANAESTIKVIATVNKRNGSVIYADTFLIGALAPSSKVDISFNKTFMSLYKDIWYDLSVVSELSSDEEHSDDTSRQSVASRYMSNMMAESVVEPQNDAVELVSSNFHVIGSFKNIGAQDLSAVPVRVEIRSINNNKPLVFKADTIVDKIYIDSPTVQVVFPEVQQGYDIKSIPIGKYRVAIIARQPDESDRTNDTAYSIFSIANDLSKVSQVLRNFNISISRNPISAYAHLNLHLNTPASIYATIYDVTGREVLRLSSLESVSGDESIPFDVDKIPNGVYYLKCNVSENIEVLKLIVLH
jgi:hypothetical protein